MLTVVHWFPLHVPCGFQTPLHNSSVPSPESSCLWIQAICSPPPSPFSPLFFSFRLIQSALPSKSRPWPGTSGWPPAPIHCSSTAVFSDGPKPLRRASPAAISAQLHPRPPSWQSHTSPATFPPNPNHFCLSLLISINPCTHGQGFSLQSTWRTSLPPPCPCMGLVARAHGPSRSLPAPSRPPAV